MSAALTCPRIWLRTERPCLFLRESNHQQLSALQLLRKGGYGRAQGAQRPSKREHRSPQLRSNRDPSRKPRKIWMRRWSNTGGKGRVVWDSFRLGLGFALVFTVMHFSSSCSSHSHCPTFAVYLPAAFCWLLTALRIKVVILSKILHRYKWHKHHRSPPDIYKPANSSAFLLVTMSRLSEIASCLLDLSLDI